MAEKLWELAVNFFQIGSFSIGGGYAIIALIEELLVNRYHWLSFTGLKIAGPLGAVVATFSCIITGFVISLSCYGFFCCHRNCAVIMSVLQGLKAVATGLIGAAGAGILLLALTGHNHVTAEINSFDGYALLIAVVSVVLLRRYRFNPVWVLVLSAGVGILVY